MLTMSNPKMRNWSSTFLDSVGYNRQLWKLALGDVTNDTSRTCAAPTFSVAPCPNMWEVQQSKKLEPSIVGGCKQRAQYAVFSALKMMWDWYASSMTTWKLFFTHSSQSNIGLGFMWKCSNTSAASCSATTHSRLSMNWASGAQVRLKDEGNVNTLTSNTLQKISVPSHTGCFRGHDTPLNSVSPRVSPGWTLSSAELWHTLTHTTHAHTHTRTRPLLSRRLARLARSYF